MTIHTILADASNILSIVLSVAAIWHVRRAWAKDAEAALKKL